MSIDPYRVPAALRLVRRQLTAVARRWCALGTLAAATCGAVGACADLHRPPEATGGTRTDGASFAGSSDHRMPGSRESMVEGGSKGGSSGTGKADGPASPEVGGDARGGSMSEGGTTGGGTMAAAGGTSTPAPGEGGASENGGFPADGGGSAADGGASSDSPCQRVTDGPVRAWSFQDLPSAVSSELHPFLAVTNSGPDIPLNEISLRYYFRGEGAGAWQAECIWVTQTGGWDKPLCQNGVALRVTALDPPTPKADYYLEVSFPGVEHEVFSNLVPPFIEARARVWLPEYPKLNQSNDYSFVPTLSSTLTVDGKVYKQTTAVTVYRNKNLMWGEEPCP